MMTTEELQREYVPNDDETFWAKNKSCELSKREHKFQWKFDIAAGVTSMDEAICVHCGEETILTRQEPR